MSEEVLLSFGTPGDPRLDEQEVPGVADGAGGTDSVHLRILLGFVKKSKDAEIKKLTISPNKKLEVSNKVIKLRRTETVQPQPAEYESFFKNDFSFMKETFQPLEKSLIVDDVKPYPKITGS